MKNGIVSVFGEAIERAAKERAHLIKLLQDSQKEYLSYVENVSEAQWNWKPGQDRWSVGETAEHILLAEGRLFSAMERAVAAPPNPDWEKSTAGKAELLERALLDRSHKAVSPESIRPQGLSKAEVIRRFTEARYLPRVPERGGCAHSADGDAQGEDTGRDSPNVRIRSHEGARRAALADRAAGDRDSSGCQGHHRTEAR